MKLRTGLPYIEPAFGKHAHPMDREQARADAVQYLTNGRRILAGWGRHRVNIYPHFRYNVTEKKAA